MKRKKNIESMRLTWKVCNLNKVYIVHRDLHVSTIKLFVFLLIVVNMTVHLLPLLWHICAFDFSIKIFIFLHSKSNSGTNYMKSKHPF